MTRAPRIWQNIVANYAGAAVAAILPILALPFYLHLLGPGEFGLIGFVMTLISLMWILDAGVSQALVPDIAQRLNGNETDKNSAISLSAGFERIYWIFAAATAVAMMLAATLIAKFWLRLDGEMGLVASRVIAGGAILFLITFPGALYRSMLVATQAQIQLNKIQIVANVLRYGGAAIALYVWPSIYAWLVWMLLVAACEMVVRRRAAWSAIGLSNKMSWTEPWNAPLIRQIAPQVQKLCVAAGLGALTTQIDKIFVSRMFSVEQFGYYVIASSCAFGALQLIYPFTQATLPVVVSLLNNKGKLWTLYLRLLSVISMVVAALGLLYVFAGIPVLRLWLHNDNAVIVIYPVLGALFLGTALNAFYTVGYMNWLVRKRAAAILTVNALGLLISIPLFPAVIGFFGLPGAALCWVVVNVIGATWSLGTVLKETR